MFAGLVDFVGEQRLLLAVPLFLQPHDFLVFAPGAGDFFPAEEMDPEQQVIGGAPLGRRRQRSQPRLPDVLGACAAPAG